MIRVEYGLTQKARNSNPMMRQINRSNSSRMRRGWPTALTASATNRQFWTLHTWTPLDRIRGDLNHGQELSRFVPFTSLAAGDRCVQSAARYSVDSHLDSIETVLVELFLPAGRLSTMACIAFKNSHCLRVGVRKANCPAATGPHSRTADAAQHPAHGHITSRSQWVAYPDPHNSMRQRERGKKICQQARVNTRIALMIHMPPLSPRR